MPFGKYSDTRMRHVPASYLDWLHEQLHAERHKSGCPLNADRERVWQYCEKHRGEIDIRMEREND